MIELRNALREAVGSPPAVGVDVNALLDAGRRRVRRRRAVAVAALGVSVVAVSLVASMIQQGSSTDRQPAPVIDHAVQVTPEVMATTRVQGDLHSGQLYMGITDDGLVLVVRFGEDNVLDRVGTLDLATGNTDWLPPIPWEVRYLTSVALTSDRLLFLQDHDYNGSGRDTTIDMVTFDRRTQSWDRRAVEVGKARLVTEPALLGLDDRVYVSANAGAPYSWWSLPIDGGSAQPEPSLQNRGLAWVGSTKVTSEVPARITLSSSGSQDVVIDGLPEGCEPPLNNSKSSDSAERDWPPEIIGAGDNLVATYSCAGGSKTVVYTTEGRLVMDIGVSDLWVFSADERLVLLADTELAGAGGVYALDLDERRLMLIDENYVAFWPRSPLTAGGLALWTVSESESSTVQDVTFKVARLAERAP